MKIVLNILLLIVSFSCYSTPTSPGQCQASNFRTEFTGKGILYGNLSTSGQNEKQGDLFLSFDYICKAWNNTSNMKFGTWGLNDSYGSNDVYRTNTWGVILKAVQPRTSVASQNNNFVLKVVDPSEINSNGLITGTLRVHLFEVFKNAKVGTWSGSNSFSPGTMRELRIEDRVVINFSDGGTYTDLYRDSLPTSVKIYNSSCTVGAPKSVAIGNVSKGSIKRATFNINIACADDVTIQNRVSTKFTNASSRASLSNNNYSLVHSGTNGVKVNMEMFDSAGSPVKFGQPYDINILNPGSATYNVGFEAAFSALSNSGFGTFSHVLNYEVTYN